MIRRQTTIMCALACALLFATNAGARERSLFASQQMGAVGITTFSVDLDSGALTQQPGIESSLGMPTVPGIAPDGSALFVPDYANGLVQAFAPDSTGPVPIPAAFLATGAGPNATVVDPAGKFLWTANYDGAGIGAAAIGSGGSLSAVTGFPVATGGTPTTLAVSPNNDFVYATTYGGETIVGYERAADGSLTAVPGSPYAHTGDPIDVEFSVDGTKLFIADQADDTISSFVVDPSTGALTEVSSSPASTDDRPTGLAAGPEGKYLFVANQGDDSIRSYAIAGDGALTAVDTAATGSDPGDVVVTPDGHFVYASNFTSGTISGFTVAGDGTLTELTGSPFGNASGAIATLAMMPDQGPVAAFTNSASGLSASFNGSGSSDPDGAVGTYAWNFGDGRTTSSSSPTASHTYASPGTYTVTLQVIDDENCSDVQIGTGQVLNCNGSAAAITQHNVTVSSAPVKPLSLTHASGKQVKSKRSSSGKLTRRIRVNFGLSLDANVTYQFQKSTRVGRCLNGKVTRKKKAKYKNFGRSVVKPGKAGPNQRTFVNKLGGKKIVPGRYRVQLRAKSADGQQTKTVTTASFCVR